MSTSSPPLDRPVPATEVPAPAAAGRRPVGRLLRAVKYTAVLAFCLVAVLVVAAAGVITGAALFPIGRVTLLSGSTIALSEAMLRTLLVALYVGVSMAGLAAIALSIGRRPAKTTRRRCVPRVRRGTQEPRRPTKERTRWLTASTRS